MSSPPPPLQRPSGRTRARWIAVCAVVPGLLLGFVAGVQLARSERAAQPPARPEAAHAAREAVPMTARERGLGSPPASTLPVAISAAAVARPSRQSLRADIEATDPGPWLARFGTVQTAPVAARD